MLISISVEEFSGEITEVREDRFVIAVIGSNFVIGFGVPFSLIKNLEDVLKKENVVDEDDLKGKFVYYRSGIMQIVTTHKIIPFKPTG